MNISTPRQNYTLAGLMLFAGVVFVILGLRGIPDRSDLISIDGVDPGFSNVVEGTTRHQTPNVRFGENEGRKCVYQGPYPWTVASAMKSGTKIVVMCDTSPWIDGWSRVYAVTVNGNVLVSYEDVVRSDKRERWLDLAVAAFFAIGTIAFYRRGKALGAAVV